jgi:hypothetical protein
MKLAFTASFQKGYIADPYWPARDTLINIQKQSGMNRAKSDANRRKALEAHLKSVGMSFDDYEELEQRAAAPFYMNGSHILIPDLHVYGFLVNSVDQARSAQRPCEPDQVRSRFTASSWMTTKSKADGVWERFAMVSAGTGQKLSNQRGLRRSQYIEKFSADGEIEFDEAFVKPSVLRDLVEFGGINIGIGASRKMGWGRFAVKWR